LGPGVGPGKGPRYRGLFFYLYMITTMKDNFSKQADSYAKYRPNYPQELFDFILQYVERQTAWDCATGNGQTAKVLAEYFKKVYATDTSQKQIDHAHKESNIFYSVQPAEQTSFPDKSFDLITVSQALHWFDFEKFYAEVTRVGKAGSWLAVWMYALPRVSTAIDELIHDYHFITLEKYWDTERRHVDANYTTIPFPFEEIQTPAFYIANEWTIDELEGYFNTSSALQKFISANGYSAVPELFNQIKPHWQSKMMKIIFPLHLRMGKVNKQ
jgi:ubiquinone/menaquinone biosynthesis C-methylase UbiE